MTPEQAIKRLKAMPAHGDSESLHGEAEDILLDFLRSQGHSEVANAFEEARDRVGFWYA